MYRIGRGLVVLTLLLSASLLLFNIPAQAQEPPFKNLNACQEGAFSTEEDFMMLEGEAFDGSPYVSDGDILSPGGQVCVRNQELVRPFSREFPTVDLGLDGLDILSFEPGLVAFSTELDAPDGAFTAGDVLITDGTIAAVIPNAQLVSPFGITYNIGLDEVKFMGDIQSILSFVESVAGIKRSDWRAGQLQTLLRRFKIDIWFSLEGTFGNFEKPILDGDLLSARGRVVATNRDLLEASVPAGIPKDGVDFGLDAFSVARDAIDSDRPDILFSTEILYNGELNFTDGDILFGHGGVLATNDTLVAAFQPAAKFLGLDALWINSIVSGQPVIESICGDDHSVADFDGGLVAVNGPGTGLYMDPTIPGPSGEALRRPCGEFVPFEGSLPQTGFKRFRVAYRDAGTPRPAWGTAPGIQTQWLLKVRHYRFIFPIGFVPYCPTANLANPGTYQLLQTDGDGWMNAHDYIDAENGVLTGCEHDLKLAVWNTNNAQPTPLMLMPPGPPNKDGHYVTWLEWETDGGAMESESVDHHVQLDNTLPAISQFEIRTPDGKVVPQCNVDNPAQGNIYQVWSQIADDYYWKFGLNLYGGAGGSAGFGPHDYRFTPDGTLGVDNTDDTGTMPDGTIQHLRDIDMLLSLGADNFVKCCYMLTIDVHDAAIRHNFNRIVASDISGSYYSSTYVLFAATP